MARWNAPGCCWPTGPTPGPASPTPSKTVHRPGRSGLTELVTSITGLSAVGAASVLAETGDPRRFTSGRALARHAGLAPRQKSSGSYTGRTRMTGHEHNKLSTGQAHAALAAALLRHLHAVISTGRRWDPAIAAGGRLDQTL